MDGPGAPANPRVLGTPLDWTKGLESFAHVLHRGCSVVVGGRTPWHWCHLTQPMHERLLHLGAGQPGNVADFAPPPVVGIRPDAGDVQLERRRGVVGFLDCEL
eukprot:3750401-Alexandrium_andersonii.AAC.1